RRWNFIKQDMDYKKLAAQVMQVTDARRLMAEMGHPVPPEGFGKEHIMGDEFDSNNPDPYIKKQMGKA
ncbi:MAG: bicarbonate-binding protein CmpA precursor, partial [Pseudomonadota bacterium]